MIEMFEVTCIEEGIFLVTAIMLDGPPVQVGTFESKDEVERGIELFVEGFNNKHTLH